MAVTVQAGTRAPLVPCQAAGPLPQDAVRSGLHDSAVSSCSPPGSTQGLWSSRQDTFNPRCPHLANDHWWWNDSWEFRDSKGANTPSTPTYWWGEKYDNLLGSLTVQLIATQMLVITCASSVLSLNWILLSFKYVSPIVPHGFVKKVGKKNENLMFPAANMEGWGKIVFPVVHRGTCDTVMDPPPPQCDQRRLSIVECVKERLSGASICQPWWGDCS